MPTTRSNNYSIIIDLILLLIITVIVYSNTFEVPWHFDDYPNIYKNRLLHITDLRPRTLVQTFFAYPEKADTFYRPIPMLSFALNWYFGKERVFGYHIVNTFIHFLTGFFLFLTVRQILRSPNMKGRTDNNSAQFIALFTAVLWTLHPIQIQGVTLIVQRMTSMSTLFYLLGIYFFLRARNNRPDGKLDPWSFTFCCIGFVLALGCKENAITFPVMLFLIEFILFQNPESRQTRRKMIWLFVVAFLTASVCAVVLIVVMKGNPVQFILKGYEIRPFNLSERLMTEPRVLVFYLSQIFYPVADRFSFTHDFVISTSLFRPWTTLPSIMVIFVLIFTAILQMVKWPIFSLGVLFFFLAHSVTATILPMEIVFEHRNYLATLFLFIPIAAGVKCMIDRYHRTNFVIYSLLLFFVPAIIIGFGWSTYIRNNEWISTDRLWEDAMEKAPLSGRPPYQLALWYADGKRSGYPGENEAERQDRLNKALLLLERASAAPIKEKRYSEAQWDADKGRIFYLKGDFSKALVMYKMARQLDPKFGNALPGMVRTLIKLRKWRDALEACRLILINKPDHLETLTHMGLIFFAMERPQDAIVSFSHVIKHAQEARILFYLGMAYQAIGRPEAAHRFIVRGHQLCRDPMESFFVLIDHSLASGKRQEADRLAQRLLERYPVTLVLQRLDELSKDAFYLPIKVRNVRTLLIQNLNRISNSAGA